MVLQKASSKVPLMVKDRTFISDQDIVCYKGYLLTLEYLPLSMVISFDPLGRIEPKNLLFPLSGFVMPL